MIMMLHISFKTYNCSLIKILSDTTKSKKSSIIMLLVFFLFLSRLPQNFHRRRFEVHFSNERSPANLKVAGVDELLILFSYFINWNTISSQLSI